MASLVEKKSLPFIKVRKKKTYQRKFKICLVKGNESPVVATQKIYSSVYHMFNEKDETARM